ncbi:uncharacterized protein ATNIH1004_002837 [Aspergillus tanneri]|uniref:Uncharacterized protein n=1 Tax=Aspergillus tanneri TaxID=1220188 RepID=A0A5M9MW45_9EURO|nr:uncharacterized protein ATNIH1004_002837 [Aspergillus tanneri]KAA8650156.1 hypothetical protein ATNIH1004_002837 [Aspergillus tanneri]
MESLHTQGQKGTNFNPNKAILASSVSRYVFKDGRITVRPESVLGHNDLYPVTEVEVDAEDRHSQGPEAVERVSEIFARQRQRGLEVASFFHGLDTLPSQFGDTASSVLGRYTDL